MANLTGDNWRDIADEAMRQTLKRNGQVIHSKYHSHLVSFNLHKNIITAFPAKEKL